MMATRCVFALGALAGLAVGVGATAAYNERAWREMRDNLVDLRDTIKKLTDA